VRKFSNTGVWIYYILLHFVKTIISKKAKRLALNENNVASYNNIPRRIWLICRLNDFNYITSFFSVTKVIKLRNDRGEWELDGLEQRNNLRGQFFFPPWCGRRVHGHTNPLSMMCTQWKIDHQRFTTMRVHLSTR